MTNKEALSLILYHLDCLKYEDELYFKGFLDALYPADISERSIDTCTNPFLIALVKRIK